MSGHVRHLYVHLPFCAHRCGYCDFVTVVGREGWHGRYVDALLGELDLERGWLADRIETVFLGGGTPTLTDGSELRRLLGALPTADDVTVEANPETVTPALARMLREAGVTRVSLGAQSFQPELLAVLERRVTPDAVRNAFYHLRDASFDNISLDLLHGIPARAPPPSKPTSTKRSRSHRSTSRTTSSKPSRARGSPTRTVRSSHARPRRWRATSSSSSSG
jgi:oxygen-independent coproporphyrinogen-3 oxidase